MFLVEVERCARVVYWGVLSLLYSQPQVLQRQLPERARLRPPAGGRRSHQRRETRRVPYGLPRVTQQQRLQKSKEV